MIQPTNEELFEHANGSLRNFYDWAFNLGYNQAIQDAKDSLYYTNKSVGRDEFESLDKLKK